MKLGVHLVISALLVALPAFAGAQERSPTLDELVDTDPHSDDPIGIDDESDVSDVEGPPPAAPEETPEEIAARGPRPPSVTARSGQVVTAIPAVRETHHAVSVNLEDGLAIVDVELTFASRARHPAEMKYRLQLPEGAALASLRACISDRCREGLALGDAGRKAYDDALRARGGDGDATPIAAAEHVRDERGEALSILAAPIPPRGTMVVRLRYVAEAPVVGGVARFTLPGRGQDPRAAPTSVRAAATAMIGVAVDEVPFESPIVRDAWYPIDVAARLPTSATTRARVLRFPCGDARCARVTATAGPRGGEAEDIVLALDASPSTEGPARSRIGPTVAAILSAAPRGSRVWALSFGATARTIIESPRAPDDVPLVPLARSVNRELGSATRIEVAVARALALTSSTRSERPAHLVVIGDGGITRGSVARRAFARARRRDLRISLVNVASRPTWPQLRQGAVSTGGRVVAAADEADLAVRGRSSSELDERIGRLFAPVARGGVSVAFGSTRVPLGDLVAGEQLVWQGVVPSGGRVSLRGAGRARRLRVDGPRARALAGIATGDRTALFAVDPADADPRAGASDARCIDARGPARRAGGVSTDDAPVALAMTRSCAPRGPARSPGRVDADSTGRGVPAETVLRMLRERVMPVARRCFRRDRAGRLHYSARATFVIRLEDRELTEASIDGRISDALRACLMSAAERLDVPRFRGAVVVRYPLYTEAIRRPPTIELIDEVAEEVDAAVPPREGAGSAE